MTAKEELTAFVMTAVPEEHRGALSKRIAAFVAESVREDRARRGAPATETAKAPDSDPGECGDHGNAFDRLRSIFGDFNLNQFKK